MIEETLCTYEQAIGLKRLSFNWPCWSVYHRQENRAIFLERSKTQADNWNAGIYVSAPTHDVAHRWLREKEKFSIAIIPQMNSKSQINFNFSIYWLAEGMKVDWSTESYETYEMAMSVALDKAIKCARFINHNNK